MGELILDGERVSNIGDPNEIEPGQWYWVKDEEGEEYFGCVVYLGSNYAKIAYPGGGSERVLFDRYFDRARYEPNPEQVIDAQIAKRREKVKHLLEKVKEITARLGVAQRAALSAPVEGEKYALAVLSNQNSIKDYEKALICAKDEQLPELFEEIKKAHQNLANWMGASALPLEAAVNHMKGSIEHIEDRVFSISLYAGLTEQVKQCSGGEPAAITDKLHVMQRRLYMDEECLLNYRHGGMDFQTIEQFDEWLCEPINRDRILPFPRCLVAMRVRRENREYEDDGTLLSKFINIQLNEMNKHTFLYIRNGEQVYRMNCDLGFGEMIFPDKSFFDPDEEKMIKRFVSVEKLVPKRLYDQMLLEEEEMKEKYEQWKRENPKKKWLRENPDKQPGQWEYYNPYHNWSRHDLHSYSWEPFNPGSAYYDDACKILSDEIKQYNRIALIIQGLFDRSSVLHPHPPARTWTPEGFDAVVKLVYDGQYTLYAGPKPDFEAYRLQGVRLLTTDSIVIGQRYYWMQREALRENTRQARDWRIRQKSNYNVFEPYGDPGPDYMSKMDEWKARSRKAVFRWERDSRSWTYQGRDKIPCSIIVPADKLFNVTVYKPGDYKQFFQDPRTRAEYLKWAPLLLAAEEYHTGNFQAKTPA